MTVDQPVLDQKQMFNAMEQSFAMITFDPQGNISWINHNFSQVMGYKIEEIQGMHHRQLCSSEFRNSQEYMDFWKDLRNGKAFHDKVKRISKDGQVLWLEAFYTPVFASDGQVQAVVKIATDITDRQAVLQKSIAEFTALVEEMTASTNTVHDASETIVNDMEALNKESEIVNNYVAKIQSVASFVKDIATQSNLIGLNASIEASRAGEHGRSFAVVANEVRKMAEKSKDSATDISDQLKEILHSLSVMVEMMKNVSRKIENNSVSINELKKTYEQIAQIADELSTVM
ncbi:methyl-accepting chemotaxis protein [Halalkalibacter nanhaiisediminis]|uniref:Methyl-accepting chemotaxis sensory transducer with Pas/Pac sensor n=1 Tax=Halalkalibacter nanhaiisediminis TaxID=688079 RepID=A0A562Q847_9BACI|nr:methyl-accepting chemotaxis protein [Halalkalibacter nanhaiisediminis]TWI52909.1 methyl-accepting chemotaxis sensory transducer with Pas/Pac sensor [Halalkalibacter nanhaiisediminis]